MNGQTEKSVHEFSVKQRREMQVLGVKDIDSFDDTGAVLRTTEGIMTVEGDELKIGVLDTERGIVTVSGKINAVFYSGDNTEEKRGIISRLFKQ